MPKPFERLRKTGALGATGFGYGRMNASQGLMNLLGLLAGGAMTRRMPRYEKAEGTERLVFDAPEGATPYTLGDVQILPAGASPRTLAHENVHTQQSRELGGLYPIMSALGGENGPLEEEAYSLPAGETPQEQGEASADRMTLEEIRRAHTSRGPARRFLAALAEGL